MICPNCDSRIRENETLVISPTKADGFFQVNHVAKTFWDPNKKICNPKWYNEISIK